MSDRYCQRCEVESDYSYKCHVCGKPFDGDGDASGAQQLRPDGGQLEETTDEIVVEAIGDLQDESKHGAPIGEVVQVGIEESEVRVEHVFETITWLYDHGEIYQPARGYLRRTDAVEDLGGERDV